MSVASEEAIPVAEVIASPYEAAARFLEQALQVGPPDPQAAYLLALAYKREGKTADARQALRRITPPDAHVLLQLGLLSLQEGQPAQAEQEFARAWELDPSSYEACGNLLLTRLTLGRLDDGQTLLTQALAVAPGAAEKRFLRTLQSLLDSLHGPAGEARLDPLLLEMAPEDEARVLALLRGLGQPETALTLLRALATSRPNSPAVYEAYVEAALVRGRVLFDQAQWGEAERLLTPPARQRRTGREAQAALLNLLGCCACMNQEFERGTDHFTEALKWAGNDPRVYQNLALAHELQGRLRDANPYWNRYFDLLDGGVPAPPGQTDYAGRLAYHGLLRLAGLYVDREKWQEALPFLQRAVQLRPDDTDLLERLFHLYNQMKRPDEARRALRRLRELRPDDPQYELYELDLIDARSLKDIEHVLTQIERVMQQHPDDPRVEERAIRMVGNVIPLVGNLCDQYTEQLGKVVSQVRHLPNYQVNWSAVHDTMRDLAREFRKLRRITNKCLALVRTEEQRRVVRDLLAHIDRKIEVCQSMSA
jgi:Flp pilus assembly protein TadD